MIITVDPTQSEDIAAFAMVKQYRLQALNVTLNGGTGAGAWQAVQGGEGYTQTVVTAVTGIELVYEDPNAIVSYTVENDDTSNYDTASDAGIILSSIEPTDNAWTYTCVFHADSVPVSSVDIDLLVYGNIARGTEQQGSPATAEEITAQVLAGLETRVTALEEEMPDKADKADTYTKAQINSTVVKLTGNQTIGGVKTLSAPGGLVLRTTSNFNAIVYGSTTNYNSFTVRNYVAGDTSKYDEDYRIEIPYVSATENNLAFRVYAPRNTKGDTNEGQARISHGFYVKNDDTGFVQNAFQKRDGTGATNIVARFDGTQWYNTANTRGYNAGSAYASDVATIGTLDAYTPMVRTTGAQTIGGTKTFTDRIHGMANYGTGGVSTSMTTGHYNTIFILPKSSISTFRAVLFAVAFRRASGTNPVFVSIPFHGITAVGISKWGSDTATTDFFVSEDDDNVYIGIKAKSDGLQPNSIQMILLSSVGFNYTPTVNNATGQPTDTPPGTLIAETS